MVATVAVATGCRSTEKASKSSVQREYLSMNISGEADGVSFTGQVRMAKDSVIWCSLSKFIELGRAMATRDSVWVQVPMLGRREAGDYATVKQRTGVGMTFGELQAILLSDKAEEEIQRLAQRMGHSVTVRIKSRQRVDKLTFPFNK